MLQMCTNSLSKYYSAMADAGGGLIHMLLHVGFGLRRSCGGGVIGQQSGFAPARSPLVEAVGSSFSRVEMWTQSCDSMTEGVSGVRAGVGWLA